MSYVAACLVGCQWGLVVSKVFGVGDVVAKSLRARLRFFFLSHLIYFRVVSVDFFGEVWQNTFPLTLRNT